MITNIFVSNGVLVPFLIIMVISFFTTRFLIGRRVKNERKKNGASIVVASLVTPVIYVVIIISLLFSDSYYKATNFNSTTWHAEPDERFKMSEDIIDSEMLIGKTREEVISILGSDFSDEDEYRIRYYIGFVPGMFRIDPDVLDIRFVNDQVAEVNQYQT